MQETAKTLRPPANDLPGVRVQIASMKVIDSVNRNGLRLSMLLP